MSLIRAVNNLTDNAPYSYTASSYAVGGTAIPVKNTNTFTASWAIQIGRTGDETTEILVLGTAVPSGTVLNTTGTTKFNHPTDTPVYAIKYDKVIFKKSTDGTAGTATAITGGTVNITPDSTFTLYDDTAGTTTDAYKIAWYASVLDTSTSDSDWYTPAGASFYSLGKIRDRVKRKLYSARYIKEDAIIDDWINEWLEVMTNTAISVNQDYSLGTVDVAHGTAGLGTITSRDFKELRRVWYTLDGVNYYEAKNHDINSYAPAETFDETVPYYGYLGDNIIEKKPNGSVGTARLVYYKISPTLDSDGDEVPVSMRNYTKSFVDYALSQAYYLDTKDSLGDRFYAAAQTERETFKNQITPRGKTGPQYIQIVDPISADDELDFY